MPDEREITIVIKGKNLSKSDFDSARQQIAGLKKDTDDASPSAVRLGSAFSAAGVALAAAGAALVAVGAGIALAAKEIADLGTRGATVSDVSNQFDILNQSIGNNADVLRGTLRNAFAGTISDFDAMQATNKGLSQGLRLSEDQFGLTARASRVLADRVGGDTKEAFDKLTMAMATGQDKTLKSIGLNIDAEAAVGRYAASLGKETNALSESETQAAKKNAILAEMQRVLAESGDAEVDFADRVDQAKVTLSNFMDQVSVGIANSPVLSAGMDALGSAFAQAFGPNQTRLVDLIVAGVNKFAMVLVDAGIYAVEFGKVGVQAFGMLGTPIGLVMQGLQELASGFVALVDTYAKTGAHLPGVGKHFEALSGVAASMQQQLRESKTTAGEFTDRMRAMASGQGTANDALNATGNALVNVKAAMVAASQATTASAAAHDNLRRSTGPAAAGVTSVGTAAAEASPMIERLTASFKKQVDAYDAWRHSVTRPDVPESFRLNRTELMLTGASAEIAARGLEEFKKKLEDGKVSVKTFGQTLREDLGGVLQIIPGTLARAFEGGGNILGAVQSIGSQIGSTLGNTIGKTFQSLGSLGGPIGAAIGSLAGPLIGKLAGLFTNKNTQEVKAYNVEIGKVRDGLLATYGPLDDLEAKAQAVGLSFKEAWGHQGKGGLEAMNSLAQEFKKRWDEMNQSLVTTRGEVDALIKRGSDLGFEFDAEGNLIKVNFQKMSEAAQKYGVDLGSLGPAFQGQRLHQSAEEIINDFTLLTKGGADVGGVLIGMKDEISALVRDSIKFGTDIPANMQPWINELFRTGQLTDENGVKMTDISQLKFSDPIKTQWEEISSGLAEAVKALKEIAATIANLPTEKNFTYRKQYVDPGPPAGWDDGGGGEPGFARGTYGALGTDFPDWGSAGTRVIVHNRESIVPIEERESTARRWLGQAAGVAAAATIAVSSPPVYIVNDFSGARQVSESEFKQIQARINEGGIQVPARVITGGGR